MSDICCHCKQKREGIGRPMDLKFAYDDLDFSGWRSGFECDSCAIKRIKSGYDVLKEEKIIWRKEQKPEDPVLSAKERTTVDWKALEHYIRVREEYRESRDAVQTLVNIGILSFNADENYAIIAAGMFVRPFNSTPVFFERFEDAKTVAEKQYSNAEYAWGIIQVKVMTQSRKGII